MNRRQKDPRINARFMTPGKYAGIFWVAALSCGCNFGLYLLLIETDGIRQMDSGSSIRVILIMILYLLILTGILCLAVSRYREKILMGPILALCDAAKKVAAGDYTVRIAPMRTDGKKDEFEVLFEDFNTMVQELSATEIMKNDFISTVSHEMRTPTAVMENYAEALLSQNLTEEERLEYTRRIHDASQRLSVLITDILQLNRLDHQKITPKDRPFNLSESIASSILNFDEKIEEKSLNLDLNLDEDLILNSDEDLLSMVWSNLISNAVKFIPEYGGITISMKTKKDSVSVLVTDTGCGMDEEDRRHVFDRFYQADTSHAGEGNGLGLALTRRIVELLHGTISVESRKGEGSTFTVTLPRS